MKKILMTLAISVAFYSSYGQSPIYTIAGSGASYNVDGAYLGWNTSSHGGETNFVNNIGGGDVGGFTFDNTTRSNVTARLMTILGNGNVGIGTTNPTSNFQIGTLNGVPTATPITLSLGATFSSTHGINPKLKVYDDGINTWGLGVSSSQLDYIVTSSYDHVFYAGGTELMRMRSGGNVGIGTTQPDQKLTVNGTIHSKEVKVDTSIPVPDYVFEPTYKLPQLSELKTYLDANHHLPEIPSAKEMEKNGINLSEMNLKLLKKVEELTLYLIDKDKEIKDLKTSQQEQIDALKSQMQSLQKNLNR